MSEIVCRAVRASRRWHRKQPHLQRGCVSCSSPFFFGPFSSFFFLLASPWSDAWDLSRGDTDFFCAGGTPALLVLAGGAGSCFTTGCVSCLTSGFASSAALR